MNDEMKVRIWDLPVRLFHWTLVVLVSISLYTGIKGGFTEMDFHMLSGYSILTLIGFRITWGFLGSKHARFSEFVTLRNVIPYARKIMHRSVDETLGHNPLGALSIIAMLLVLGVQAITGLFANDDIMLEGPLTHLVSDEVSNRLTGVHHLNAKLIYLLVGLPLTAIAFYELYRGERLILPMLTGKKRTVTPAHEQPRVLREIVTALILLAITAGGVYYLVKYV